MRRWRPRSEGMRMFGDDTLESLTGWTLTWTSSTLIDVILPVRGPKGDQAKGKLLVAQMTSSSRSHPGSPAFAPAASPSLAATTATAQDRLKQQRFPVIHELAVDEHSFDDLKKKWDEGTEEEFRKLLDKVADFNQATQKWQLK